MCHHLYLTDVENIHYKLNFPRTTIPKCKLQNLYSKTPWLIDWYNCHLAFLETCFQHIIYFSITLSVSHWFSSIHLSCRWSLLVSLWSNTFLECFILMDSCKFKNDILDVILAILSSQPLSELRKLEWLSHGQLDSKFWLSAQILSCPWFRMLLFWNCKPTQLK